MFSFCHFALGRVHIAAVMYEAPVSDVSHHGIDSEVAKTDDPSVRESSSASSSEFEDPGPQIPAWRFYLLSLWYVNDRYLSVDELLRADNDFSLSLCLFLSFIDSSIVSTAL